MTNKNLKWNDLNEHQQGLIIDEVDNAFKCADNQMIRDIRIVVRERKE